MFDYASDIHVQNAQQLQEIRDNFIKNQKSDTLLLGGDISDDINNTIQIVNNFKDIYDNVFSILGNHDYYLNKIGIVDNYISNNENFLSPENPYVIIGDSVIIGVTGWYDLRCYEHLGLDFTTAKQVWKDLKRDSKWIIFKEDEDFMPWDLAEIHKNRLYKLVEKFNNDDKIKNIYVMTHMIPSRDFVSPKGEPSWDMATPCYVNSDMLDIILPISDKIKYWMYGHTHERTIFNYKNINFINNALGYGFERLTWTVQNLGNISF